MAIELENALKLGSVLNAEFHVQEVLGADGFGITYKASKRGSKPVAIKEFFPADNAIRKNNDKSVTARSTKDADFFTYGLDAFKKEADTLSRFKSHPNIVTVQGYFEANGTAYMVMDYEEGQTLDEWLKSQAKRPSEQQLLQLALPILEGLREIHDNHYLHRDIKPENIYIRSDGRPILIDFGSSRQVLGERTRNLTIMLTDGYAAKEQYSRQGNQGAWTDIYGVGAVLWRIVSGKTPASAPDRGEAKDSQTSDPLLPAREIGKGHYSEGLLHIIDWMLGYLPQDRPPNTYVVQVNLLRYLAVTALTPQTTLLLPDPPNKIFIKPSSICTLNIDKHQDIGARERQEDSFADKRISNMQLAVLADGMGGYDLGGLASKSVIAGFISFVEQRAQQYVQLIPDLLVDATYSANASLAQLKQNTTSNMGSTMIGLLIQGNHAWWVSVGNSSLYLWRDGRLYKINADHSHYQDLRQKVFLGEISNEQAINDPERDGLTSALMGREMKYVDVSRFGIDLRDSDKFLLASDGLETITQEQIATVMRQAATPQQISEILAQQVKRVNNPYQDNVSILVVSVTMHENQETVVGNEEKKAWWKRWLS
jgi:serine/threonine protein kinase